MKIKPKHLRELAQQLDYVNRCQKILADIAGYYPVDLKDLPRVALRRIEFKRIKESYG